MQETKTTFTPGPWRAIGGDSVYTDDSSTGAYDRSLADLSTGPLSASEKAANARLMAAAPELYGALRAFVAVYVPTHGPDATYDSVYTLARAALAKAGDA